MFLSGMLSRGRTRVKTGRPIVPGRAIAWLLAIAWMGGIFYLSHQSAPVVTAPGNFGSVLGHLGLYAVLAFLIYQVLVGRGSSAGEAPVWVVAVVAFGLTVLYGVGDETHQAFVPGRVASEADLLADAGGAVFGLSLAIFATQCLRIGRHRP